MPEIIKGMLFCLGVVLSGAVVFVATIGAMFVIRAMAERDFKKHNDNPDKVS